MASTNNSGDFGFDNIVILAENQKEHLLELWEADVCDVKALVHAIFPGKDGRSKEGVAIKTFLASKGLSPKTTAEKEKKTQDLTEEEKQFVDAQAGTHRPLEIARILFKNPKLSPLDAQARAVVTYYNTLDPKMRFLPAADDESSLQEYKAPRNLAEVVTKVRKYLFDVVDEIGKLSQRRRDELSFLTKFMNVHRYVYTMNRLANETERTLFESSYVRFVHNKPDLTEEDIDLYLNLCIDIVSYNRMMEEEKMLRLSMLETEEEEDSNGNPRKPSMTTVEWLSQLRKDMGSNHARQKKTLEDLTTKRSTRMESRIRENASVLNLVEAWKDKEKRDRLIKQQLLRKELLKKETDRLSTMEGVMFEFFGVGTEEAIG